MINDTINLEECWKALGRIDDQVDTITETLERDYLLALAPQKLSSTQRLPTGQYVTTGPVEAARHEEAAVRLLERYQAADGKLQHLAWLAEKLQIYWRLEAGNETEEDRAAWEALRTPAPGLN